MGKVKKAVEIILSVLLWCIILLTALFTFTTLATRDDRSVARVLGFTPLIVKSDSMAPTFYAGDLIIISACDTAALQQGDVITFHTIINNEYALNTHRIEAVTEEGGFRSYTTKGDNNAIADARLVTDSDIVGQYKLRVPVLGRVLTFLSSSMGFLIVIVLPMLLFLIYQIYHLVIVSINLKKAIAVEEATRQAEEDAQAEEALAKKDAEAEAKLAEAQAALAEAKRLKEEAEARLAQVTGAEEVKEITSGDKRNE